MQLINHIGEKFEIRILDKQKLPNNETVEWWYKSTIIITEGGKKRKTNLRFLTREDLFLLSSWLENLMQYNYEKTVFNINAGINVSIFAKHYNWRFASSIY